jgi:hypothetical protein
VARSDVGDDGKWRWDRDAITVQPIGLPDRVAVPGYVLLGVMDLMRPGTSSEGLETWESRPR